jgi:hypothetical protein
MKATQMLWMYTTLQRGRGRQLSSAWRVNYFLLHRLGTWPYLPEGTQDVRHMSGLAGGWKCLECWSVQLHCVAVFLAFAFCLIRFAAGWDTCCPSNAVDVYNRATGTWSTAQLSVARDRLSATSIGSLVLFAGGYVQGTLLRLR